ncbi:hypothetical protein LJR159_000973 [Pseudomonas brassicacearum]|uniref:hypothetical protein n=1 Tax=Pseudomonas brassicacearum TaxID=930166 RepID=UPI003ED0D48A
MRTSLVLTGTLLLSACTTDRMTDPAIVTTVKEKTAFTALTTTADRRIFIINASTNRTCGEPPAGVAENVSASLSNSLSVALKTQAGDPSAKNSFAESAAKTVANVSQKTQGLMLYEAMSSGLCMAYANEKTMTPIQYAAELQQAGKLASELIKLELTKSGGKIGPNEKTLQPTEIIIGGGTTPPALTDGSTAAAVAAGSSAVTMATSSAEAGQAAGIAIAESMPIGASTAQQTSIITKFTDQAVTQVMGDKEKGKEAAVEAAKNFSQSSSATSSVTASRNLTNALEDVKKPGL